MSKLQTYVSERKKLFKEKFVNTLLSTQSDVTAQTWKHKLVGGERIVGIYYGPEDIESFNEETIEGVMAIVREVVESKREKELFIGKTQYDFYKGDVAWVNNAPLDNILQALNTKE